MKKEDVKNILSTIGNWITAADNKVSVGLGIFSFIDIFLGFIFVEKSSLLSDSMSSYENKCLPIFIYVVIFLSLGCFVVALIHYCSALSPRFNGKASSKEKTKNSSKNKKRIELMKPNSYFYEDVAAFENENDFITYKTKYYKYTDEELHILKEIYHNSKICHRKMHLFRAGLWISFASLIFGILSIVLVLFL